MCVQKINGPTILSPNKFWSENFCTNIFTKKFQALVWQNFGQQNFWLDKFWVQQIFGSKTFGSRKILAPKECWSKRFCFQQHLDFTKFWSKKILAPQKIGSKKFAKDWIRNRGYIPDMDKCHQDRCCLDKCHPDIWHLVRWPKRPSFKVGPNWFSNRYCWYGQVLPGKMLLWMGPVNSTSCGGLARFARKTHSLE